MYQKFAQFAKKSSTFASTYVLLYFTAHFLNI